MLLDFHVFNTALRDRYLIEAATVKDAKGKHWLWWFKTHLPSVVSCDSVFSPQETKRRKKTDFPVISLMGSTGKR